METYAKCVLAMIFLLYIETRKNNVEKTIDS